METRILEVIRKIEFKFAMEEVYWKDGKEKSAERKENQIDGMMEALEILTGKKYDIEDGKVVER